ncbi:hypothetical protein LJR118_006700 [Acidovorax sp. LjRoot118]|uniref:hypothetical protein n=1 Tax=Acidovorax sp. LjRoot118 TaxID=3342256 RepID=UPI003ED058C9
MKQLSMAQRALGDLMKAGGRVIHDAKTGRFVLDQFGKISQVDQRPIEAMLQSGALEKDAFGHCKLVEEAGMWVPLATQHDFAPGDTARWRKVERGELKFCVEVTVVRATSKQVRIRTAGGNHQVVRPRALEWLERAGHAAAAD